MNVLDDIFDQVYDKKNNVMLKNDAHESINCVMLLWTCYEIRYVL